MRYLGQSYGACEVLAGGAVLSVLVVGQGGDVEGQRVSLVQGDRGHLSAKGGGLRMGAVQDVRIRHSIPRLLTRLTEKTVEITLGIARPLCVCMFPDSEGTRKPSRMTFSVVPVDVHAGGRADLGGDEERHVGEFFEELWLLAPDVDADRVVVLLHLDTVLGRVRVAARDELEEVFGKKSEFKNKIMALECW